jgi:hypothetical protein
MPDPITQTSASALSRSSVEGISFTSSSQIGTLSPPSTRGSGPGLSCAFSFRVMDWLSSAPKQSSYYLRPRAGARGSPWAEALGESPGMIDALPARKQRR